MPQASRRWQRTRGSKRRAISSSLELWLPTAAASPSSGAVTSSSASGGSKRGDAPSPSVERSAAAAVRLSDDSAAASLAAKTLGARRDVGGGAALAPCVQALPLSSLQPSPPLVTSPRNSSPAAATQRLAAPKVECRPRAGRAPVAPCAPQPSSTTCALVVAAALDPEEQDAAQESEEQAAALELCKQFFIMYGREQAMVDPLRGLLAELVTITLASLRSAPSLTAAACAQHLYDQVVAVPAATSSSAATTASHRTAPCATIPAAADRPHSGGCDSVRAIRRMAPKAPRHSSRC